MNKKDLINYLVDVLGNSEEEANKICSVWGTSYLTPEQLQECQEFNS